MPVVILIQRFPIAQAGGAVQRIRRSMKHHVKFLSDGTDTLLSMPQEAGEVADSTCFGKTRAFKRRPMSARQYPGFIGHTRGVRTNRDIVAAQFQHAQSLPLFLPYDVAKHAAFLLLV